MIPVRTDWGEISRSIPRESGDDQALILRILAVSSVFPARAGMIPGLDHAPISDESIPRESGDDPTRNTLSGTRSGYSPRERG